MQVKYACVAAAEIGCIRALALITRLNDLEMSAFGIPIPRECVRIFGAGTSKHAALTELAHAVASAGVCDNVDALIQAIFERESVMSTGIGSGIAVPHVRIPEVKTPTIAVGLCPHGIDYDTLDNVPVQIIILFAMPASAQKEYLRLLAKVMLTLKSNGFPNRLLSCSSPEEVAELLNSEDPAASGNGK